MNNNINKYMRNNKRNDSPDSLVKQLVCEDGFTMSVQIVIITIVVRDKIMLLSITK